MFQVITKNFIKNRMQYDKLQGIDMCGTCDDCDDLLRSFIFMVISELNDSKTLDEAKSKVKGLSILLCFLKVELPQQKPLNALQPLTPALLT